jgi:hypothetical protein
VPVQLRPSCDHPQMDLCGRRFRGGGPGSRPSTLAAPPHESDCPFSIGHGGSHLDSGAPSSMGKCRSLADNSSHFQQKVRQQGFNQLVYGDWYLALLFANEWSLLGSVDLIDFAVDAIR